MDNHNSNDSLLELFVFEFSQLINQLEGQILLNEKMNNYTDSAVNEIFRIMHTLKGSSAMMGLENITSLAHCMEDLFFCIRNGEVHDIDHAELADILLDCVDFLTVEELKIRAGDSLGSTNIELMNKIKSLIPTSKKETSKQDSALASDIWLSPLLYDQEKDMPINFYHASIRFEEGIGMENMHAYTIVHKLKSINDETYSFPTDLSVEESAEIICNSGLHLFMITDCCYETIENILKESLFVKELELLTFGDITEFNRSMEFIMSGEKDVTVCETIEPPSELDSSINNIVTKADAKESKLMGISQSLISVNVAKLDMLMDMIGELVIAEAMVTQNADLKGLKLNNFNKAARHLSKITSEVQDLVMAIRMVPLTATFHKMYRIVRDMNKKLGKEVELVLLGEDTEVDKNIIEHISDPLMHLVRNAIDHGIETPNERIQAGKERNGTVTIEARNSGSDVIIQIKDDGRGLKRDKILKKARDNNLITQPEAAISNKELYNMILLPGFSTNDNITEFSGRGVGMDVVSSNIAAVGGSVTVDSIPNEGTTILLKIPMTLAIIDGINIKVGKSHYTIPTTNIKEFFKPNNQDIIVDPDGNEIIMVRGLCYPVIKIFELFQISEAKKEFADGIMIMIEDDGQMACIFADELIGQQQVVVKSLPDYVRATKKIHGLSGCTLLGNGEISLILDVSLIMSQYK